MRRELAWRIDRNEGRQSDEDNAAAERPAKPPLSSGPTLFHRVGPVPDCDKEREMSNYDVSWKASAFGMWPFDEDGDEFGPIAGPTGPKRLGVDGAVERRWRPIEPLRNARSNSPAPAASDPNPMTE